MTYSGGMRGSPPQALRAWGGWECLSAYGLQGIPILPISVGQEPSRPKGRRKKGLQGTSNEAVRVSAKSQSLLRDFSSEKEIDPNSTEIALLLQHLPKELQEHARREGKKTVKLDQRPLFPWGNEFPKGEELWKTEKEKLALLQEAYYKAVQTISFLQD